MTGTHKHKCGSCAHIWEHSDDMAGNKQAHTCENCGAEEYNRFYANPQEKFDTLMHNICRLFGAHWGERA